MRKNVFEKFGLMFIFAAVLVMVFGAVSVMAEEVKFETFITSVKAGEFVLSEEDNDEFVDAVKDGNTERAMEIYKDYFDGNNDADEAEPVDTKTAIEDTNADIENETPVALEPVAENAVEDTAVLEPAVVDDLAAESADTASEPEIEPAAEQTVEAVEAVEEAEPETETPAAEVSVSVAEPVNNTSGLSDAEYLALCKIVQAEAPGEGLIGKMMVANVVLNRVASPSYPSTVSGVVSQRGQFTPFRNGAFARAIPNAETIMAVDRALAGENNAVGCYSFKSTRSRSSWGHKTLAFVYGHHMFYY